MPSAALASGTEALIRRPLPGAGVTLRVIAAPPDSPPGRDLPATGSTGGSPERPVPRPAPWRDPAPPPAPADPGLSIPPPPRPMRPRVPARRRGLLEEAMLGGTLGLAIALVGSEAALWLIATAR